jgi:hypothetical protein
VITNEKMCQIFKYELIKSIQSDLQKCITWPIEFRKGKQNGTIHTKIIIFSQIKNLGNLFAYIMFIII